MFWFSSAKEDLNFEKIEIDQKIDQDQGQEQISDYHKLQMKIFNEDFLNKYWLIYFNLFVVSSLKEYATIFRLSNYNRNKKCNELMNKLSILNGKLTEENEELMNALMKLENDYQNIENELKDTKHYSDSKDFDIIDLKADIYNKDNEIRNLNFDIYELKSEIKTLKNEKKENDPHIYNRPIVEAPGPTYPVLNYEPGSVFSYGF